MKILRLISALGLLLWLAGCSAPAIRQEPATDIDWPQQQKSLQAIHQWNILGRISVQTRDNGGQADFAWQQQNRQDYRIRLTAPLGAGTTWIKGSAEGVELITPSGEHVSNGDVDQLMMQVNGWPLPVSGLYYWVRGLPSPRSTYVVTRWHNPALPEVIEQDGWRIEFRSHHEVSGRWLPRKLFISRLDELEVDVRLIIRQWDTNDV